MLVCFHKQLVIFASSSTTMGRTPCCSTEGIRKGAWTSDEDEKLSAYIEKHGEGGWRTLPQKAGLQRCGKSCRLRWTNYLRPDIKRGEFSAEEEQKIIELHATLGNRWSAIAKQLTKRTDNEIKNYWNTHLKKRLMDTTSGSSNSTDYNQNINSNNDTNHSSQGDQTNLVFRNAPCNVMPRSASAKLLNRLATKLPSSHCLDALKDDPFIYSPSTFKDVSIGDASSSGSDSRPSLSSARSVLNKMARSINRPTVRLDMVKSILSKTSNRGTDTSIGDGIFATSASNVQSWKQPSTSMSTEAAENVESDKMRQDVPSHGGVQNDHNGNGSVESLTEDFNLDFLQDWAMMDDDDDNVTGVLGGGSNEGCVSSTSNGDSHNIESPISPFIFVNDFEPETSISWELSSLWCEFPNF